MEAVTFAPTLLVAAIALPALLAPVVLALGRAIGARTGYLALLAPVVSVVLLSIVVAGWEPGTVATASISWVPTLGINLTFILDGISIFYGFIIGGIGVLVCWYALAYFDAEKKNLGWFYACLLLFMSSMLGAVFSNNLLSLFVFWEITGIASFLLIGFTHEDPEARTGARRALLVTVATGLCLMTGFIMLGQLAGTYELTAIISGGGEWMKSAGLLAPVTLLMIMLGAFGKSAQFPFHFWLPGAMAAPTPVSTYLHSATMVKLGVFLTARMFPVFHELPLWLPLASGVGFFTMLLGAWMALRSHDLKAILAYSTVSQLGFLIAYYGLGSAQGVRYDLVHVISHVFYKGSLFMMAGIVDHATGTRDLRRLGGLGAKMPLTAAAALVGVASLAAMPLTTGFISKEIMLATLVEFAGSHRVLGILFLSGVVLSATLTVAFALRLFLHAFRGPMPASVHFHAPSLLLQIPPLLLASLALGFGIVPGQLGALLDNLRVPYLHEPGHHPLHLWHGFNVALLLSAVAIGAGIFLYRHLQRRQWNMPAIPAPLRFDEYFDRGVDGLGKAAKKLTLTLRADWPPAYLPIVIGTLLIIFFSAVLTHLDQLAGMRDLPWDIDPWRCLVGLLVTIGLIAVLRLRRWTAQLIALSVTGFFLTFYFVLYRAPDLAMTQILVESASVVLVLVLVARFSTGSRAGTRFEFRWNKRQILRAILSIGMGVMTTLLVLFADLNRHPDPVGPHMLQASQPLAHGTNAVNTILVDFRAFDTMGEITVLLIAALAGMGLLVRYRRSKRHDGHADAYAPPGFLMGRRKEP
ncbi:hydrogen gas-evolving membrane-bound hydrogenase subunit E [Roseimicrobium sp. ORNL1]|uniref:hydrogen gas-evolving membrane-bound hydrogenase subunit E n=1 Tax=Roseimicrobium sp. ORNL1 TaxID=2711231 RepID=UPI0013E135CE|nr:hydrogen gas-evolving membrane-bound hydrogenase subunit E [Roseimicrobium sp. ORNL1]QIF01818.1 DUF4040 domain-containing protein [Roseimicrobium sp. ORNL1]